MAEKLNPTIEERFTQLQKATERRGRSPQPKIQRVAHHLRNREHFAKHYSPQLVSMGPIHHGDTNLQPGEQYKLMLAAMYVESTGELPQTLHKKIADNIKKLKDLFDEDLFTTNQFKDDAIQARGFHDLDEMLSWMLFVDGCSLLHIMQNEPEGLNLKFDQMDLLMRDVFLLENQLPYQVLKLLWIGEEAQLIEKMQSLVEIYSCFFPVTDEKHIDHLSPTHLLDLLRRFIMGSRDFDEEEAFMRNRDPEARNRIDSIPKLTAVWSIQKLKAGGITVKASPFRSITDIHLSYGLFSAKLMLPAITGGYATATTFLNLIAYEICLDFKNDYMICSFAGLLGSLIAHPEDVKELKSAGILDNDFGSDEEVATLFKTISTDFLPDVGTYKRIGAKLHNSITNHYRRFKINTWINETYNAYFRSPETLVRFLAATLVILLTFIQTWYAVPSRTN